MTEMVWIERDTDGAIKGVYLNQQPGYAEEQLPRDDPEVVAFFERLQPQAQVATNDA